MEISVVLATFNGENYLADQIDSILKQNIKPDELIVCDDCSSDATVEIIKKYKQNASVKITLLQHYTNEGVLSSFKDSVNSANGDIIFFCDQDDYWYENKTEEFIKVFGANPNAEVVFSNADIVDSELRKRGITLWNTIKYLPQESEAIKLEMFKRNVFTGMCMAVKRNWLMNLPEFSLYMLHDEFIGWCAAISDRAVALNKTLVAYRQHEKNVIGSNNYSKFKNTKQMKKQVLESSTKTRNKYTDLKRIANDGNTLRQIQSAEAFYSIRIELLKTNKIKAFVKCLNEAVKGNYKKYCSQTERAFIKDIACIVL